MPAVLVPLQILRSVDFAQNDNENAEGFWLVILSKAKDLRGAMCFCGQLAIIEIALKIAI